MIYNVVGMWNEFAFANNFLNDIRVKTLPLSALPTIILFIIFQDKLVKGMMAGAVKG